MSKIVMPKGKLKVAGQNEWRDVSYNVIDAGLVITDPPGLLYLIANREVHIQLEDGAIRRGLASGGGKVVFAR